MRDIKRINPIIEQLQKIWLENPDFRLGQLIMVITKTGETNSKLFYLEDDDFETKLSETEKQFAENKKENKKLNIFKNNHTTYADVKGLTKKENHLSTSSYIEFERNLVDILQDNNWITSFESNRQNSVIKWSSIGQTQLSDFVKNVNLIYPIEDSKQEEFLYEFAFYHNILKKT
jgi:uncharacterized protein YihD (DUF1040 family)